MDMDSSPPAPSLPLPLPRPSQVQGQSLVHSQPNVGAPDFAPVPTSASASASASSPYPRRASTLPAKEWLNMVCSRQQERDPETARRQRERANLRLKARSHYVRCSKLEFGNKARNHFWSEGVNEVSSATTAKAATLASSSRSMTLQSLRKSLKKSSAAAAADDDDDEDEYAHIQEQMMALPSAASFSSAPAAPPISSMSAALINSPAVQYADNAQDVGEAVLEATLEKLRVEPKDDTKLAAMFKLFETHSESVSEAREGLVAFWNDVKSDFSDHPQVLKSTTESVKSIDKTENLGIHFDESGRRWFVYDMSRKVTKNSDFISGILRDIRIKIDLLGKQDQCPVCLEPFEGSPVTTLSCAHQLCTDCWKNWSAVCPGNPTCPLCKEENFHERIYSLQLQEREAGE